MITDERLAELDAAYEKQAGTPFGENWIHLNTAAKHHIFAAYPDLRAHIGAQAATIAALQAFKDYVHERLDAAGIPTHPDGRHSVAGCRIGDRLDIALDAQAATIARQDEALNIAHTAFADCDQSNPMQVEAIAIVRAALTGAA